MVKLCANLPLFVTLNFWCPAATLIAAGWIDHSLSVTLVASLAPGLPPVLAAVVGGTDVVGVATSPQAATRPARISRARAKRDREREKVAMYAYLLIRPRPRRAPR